MPYQDVFRILNTNRIKYLVIGGIAVNLHGFTRMTLDLDLIISLDEDNKTKFYKLIKSLRFKTKKPIEMKRKTGRERDLLDTGYLKQIKKREKKKNIIRDRGLSNNYVFSW